MDPLIQSHSKSLASCKLMIISSQRTPKCAHLDSSLRRQKTNKISAVPVVHIKARNVSARGSFQFSSSGKKCKKSERVLSFFFVLFISGVSSSEQPDWRSFFSLTHLCSQTPAIHHNVLSPCCRYPRVLRADATRRHQIHSTEDCRNHSHR